MEDDNFQFDTLAVRAGAYHTEYGAHTEPIFLTSSFVFDSPEQAAARFSGAEPGNIYSRFTNPTVDAFVTRLAALEGAEAGIATSSGMSAIMTVCLGLLSAGDRIVASHSIFGSTTQLFTQVLSRFGITTEFVGLTDLAAWEKALKQGAKFAYLETPSNPLTDVADIAALKQLTERYGALLVVDNCFCTPALQKPIEFGADLVVHSATKFIDGQGRVLGGAVVGKRALIESSLLPVLRTTGPCLSPFNAWLLLKGLETLSIRMERMSASALQLAQWLSTQPMVEAVYYPGLASHPQFSLAARQQRAGGAIVTFTVKGGRAEAWNVVRACRLFSVTANIGDARSTITHPATTTHGRIAPDVRQAARIGENLIRLSVGLENAQDLQADLQKGFSS